MKPAATAVLAVNCGSSSIKFAVYPCRGEQVAAAILTGTVEGLEPGGTCAISIKNDPEKYTLPAVASGEDQYDAALNLLSRIIARQTAEMKILAVAHRIVHGGERYAKSVLLSADVLEYLHTLDSLAPLHQPHNLAGVEAFQRVFPDVPQVACFDTGFHADMPALEITFALPASLRASGIRRYGFHGLSYRFVAARLQERSSRAHARTIMAHLGNGASLCAMLDGQSRATTMGFSALDGLMMGSRCGALDPGVVLHLMRLGWDVSRIERCLYKESGLLGVSGLSADMRTLRASTQASAQTAIDLFAYRVVRECGALSACLGGLDVLAFTGGIGEHDHLLRDQVCARLAYLGVQVDQELNRAATGEDLMAIHAADSSVEVWVVPTDEGRIAASDAARLLALASTS